MHIALFVFNVLYIDMGEVGCSAHVKMEPITRASLDRPQNDKSWLI